VFWSPGLLRLSYDITSDRLFANHSKSFIRRSYVIYTFTYRKVELVFVLSYIYGPVFKEQSSIVGPSMVNRFDQAKDPRQRSR
jgi:hypothetical protein